MFDKETLRRVEDSIQTELMKSGSCLKTDVCKLPPCACITALATAALAAAWEWKDISEAPKDGTRFLAWFPQNRHEQIFPVAWAENIYDEGFGWTLDDGESAVLTYDRPTYWMPLPPSPEACDE